MNRKDGKKVKKLDGIHSLIPFIMPKRCDADVYLNTKIDVTNLTEYLENLKKKDKYQDMTYFHCFCSAISKVIYNRPLLNRFIINKNFYDRNDVSISFVAKKEFTDESDEVFTVIKIQEDDNIFSISNKIAHKVKNVRNHKTNVTDNFINNIGSLPKCIRWLLVKLIKFADNHDLIPNSLTDNSIYHSSVLLSNLGSIKCGAIYHHLTDLGTNSIIMTIGEIKEEAVIVNGKVNVRKVCEFGVNIDERIADGFYFAKALKLFEYIILNPKVLEEPVNKKIDIKIR